MDDFDYDFYDQIEAPCEVCGISFPIQLLYEHELLIHNGEQQDEVPSADPFKAFGETAKDQQQYHVQTEDPFERLVTTARSELQTSSVIDLGSVSQNDNEGKNLPKEKAVIKDSVTFSSKKEQAKEILKAEPVAINSFFEGPELSYEELIPEESGTKIMTYGTSKKKSEREVEKPTYRVPTLLHMNNVDRKEKEAYVMVSDDDDEDKETLEDFWKRAEIRLSQQLNKAIQL